jgi:head-tail adaptor
MPQPGNFRDVLELQTPVFEGTRSDTGRPSSGPAATWETVTTLRGDVQESGSSEVQRGGRNVPDETYTVMMHQHSNVVTNARLIWKNNGNQTLRVQSVSRMGEQDKYIEVSCTYSGD